MNDPVNVLVLGVGGNVSQGILKALALSTVPCRVVGACVDPLSAGLYTADRAYVAPMADDPRFVDWLLRTCKAERIDAILSGVEPVLEVLSIRATDIRRETGAVPLVSPPEVLAIGGDKLLTCRWLERQGFDQPRYADAGDPTGVERLGQECGWRLIAKPRQGKGSRGVLRMHDRRQLDQVTGRPGYVIQEYVGDEADEYTAACFVDRDGGVRGTMVMRRELVHGTTHRAQAGDFPGIRAESARIAAALRPVGPCNVQCRLAGGDPVCFELNVRFSGTVPMRARLGFNDVEAAIRHYVLGEAAVDLPVVTRGVALRYWNEIYVDPGALERVEGTGGLEDPRAWATRVEDYGLKRSNEDRQ